MSTFVIKTLKSDGSIGPVFRYKSDTSELLEHLTGKSVVKKSNNSGTSQPYQAATGKASPRILKISLGLSCNYECEYCSQRFVPRADETNPGDVQAFIDGLDSWVKDSPESIEFWGGEPLVYIKTLKPLAEAIKAKYPQATLCIITNGSLLNDETNEWLDRMGFTVGLSHDGPGQHVRGPDPLQDPEKKAAILGLYKRLAPQGRMSFNSMVNRSNISRAAIQRFFVQMTGDPNVPIGEGSFVDAYDEGGMAQSLQADEFHNFRKLAFHEIRTGQASNIQGVRDRVMNFVMSIHNGRLATSLGQKCGMDNADNLAVDLRGNVLTCQNTSAASVAPNGKSHLIGHVSDLSSVKLDTSTHWSNRKDCPSCPMLQICKGSCMFLEGPLWESSCNNAYSDAVPVFAAAIEYLTGFIPVYIEGDFRADRKDIFGQVYGIPETPKRKVIPIKASS